MTGCIDFQQMTPVTTSCKKIRFWFTEWKLGAHGLDTTYFATVKKWSLTTTRCVHKKWKVIFTGRWLATTDIQKKQSESGEIHQINSRFDSIHYSDRLNLYTSSSPSSLPEKQALMIMSLPLSHLHTKVMHMLHAFW